MSDMTTDLAFQAEDAIQRIGHKLEPVEYLQYLLDVAFYLESMISDAKQEIEQ